MGMEFKFDRYGMFGGAWHGTLYTDLDQEQMALSLAGSSVREITPAEWRTCTKKPIPTDAELINAPYLAKGRFERPIVIRRHGAI